MNATPPLPPPTHHCVGGKSGVRWEGRGGGEKERGGGVSPLSSQRIFRGGKSNKMRGIAVPEEEEGLSSTTVSPIEIGNEPPSRKRDLGSVSDAAARLLLDKVNVIGSCFEIM